MSDNEPFEPDWASPPGDTILDLLVSRGGSTHSLAKCMGLTVDEIDDLLNGRIRITMEIARLLTTLLGGSESFWIRRDELYVRDMIRLGRAAELG